MLNPSLAKAAFNILLENAHHHRYQGLPFDSVEHFHRFLVKVFPIANSLEVVDFRPALSLNESR